MSYLEKDVMSIIDLYSDLENNQAVTDENLNILDGLVESEIFPQLDKYQRARQWYVNQAENIDKEIKRLQERKKQFEGSADAIKDRIFFAVKNLGGKIKTNFFTFSRGERKSLVITENAAVPEEFYKVEKTLNKKELENYIKETGELYDGVEFQSKEYLSVR